MVSRFICIECRNRRLKTYPEPRWGVIKACPPPKREGRVECFKSLNSCPSRGKVHKNDLPPPPRHCKNLITRFSLAYNSVNEKTSKLSRRYAGYFNNDTKLNSDFFLHKQKCITINDVSLGGKTHTFEAVNWFDVAMGTFFEKSN